MDSGESPSAVFSYAACSAYLFICGVRYSRCGSLCVCALPQCFGCIPCLQRSILHHFQHLKTRLECLQHTKSPLEGQSPVVGEAGLPAKAAGRFQQILFVNAFLGNQCTARVQCSLLQHPSMKRTNPSSTFSLVVFRAALCSVVARIC